MINLSYRNQKNAEATARYWNKSLDKPDWYKVEALSEDEAEIMVFDVIGWPFNDAAELVRALAGMKQKTINSPGGDVFDAMAIFNALQSHKSKIITRNEALAASSASFLMLAGKDRQAYKNSMVMVHEPWAVTGGNQHELREIANVLGMINDNMIDIYAGGTNVGKREWKDMMAKGETWWTAKQAKEKGFIDTIIDGKAAKAQFDLSVFANVPDELRADDHEPTEREIEKLLRDAGVPRNKAKAILAGCRGGEGEADEVKATAQKTLSIFGG
jgi:ATP-dependent protease ClpP protease subunit